LDQETSRNLNINNTKSIGLARNVKECCNVQHNAGKRGHRRWNQVTQVTQVPSHFQKAPEVRPWHHLAEGGLAIYPPETSNLCLKILMRLMSLKIGQKCTANAVKMREEIGRRQRPLDFWREGNAPKIGQRKLSR